MKVFYCLLKNDPAAPYYYGCYHVVEVNEVDTEDSDKMAELSKHYNRIIATRHGYMPMLFHSNINVEIKGEENKDAL